MSASQANVLLKQASALLNADARPIYTNPKRTPQLKLFDESFNRRTHAIA